MDYTELAAELLRNAFLLRRAMEQRKVDDFLKGGPFIIQYLYDHGGVVLPNEISSAMMISSARVAAVLNNLEGKELITREIDKSDRRRILVSLTDKGKAAAEGHRRDVKKGVSQMLERIGKEDSTELVRILGKLADIMENWG